MFYGSYLAARSRIEARRIVEHHPDEDESDEPDGIARGWLKPTRRPPGSGNLGGFPRVIRMIVIVLVVACISLVALTAVDKYDERSCTKGRGIHETYGRCDGFLPW